VSFEIITIASAIGIVVSATAGFINGYFHKSHNKKETLEDRINKLTSALQESSHLVTEVESEINERKNLVQELQKDAEKYEKLVSINKEQVEAVAQLLQGELRKEGNKSFWKGIIANFIFFILGAGVSIALSIGL
jgi:peptidoglycan hydrolase CwlO-like protein